MEKELPYISNAAAALGGQLAEMSPAAAVSTVHTLLCSESENGRNHIADQAYDTLDDYVEAALSVLEPEPLTAFFESYATSADLRDQQDVLGFLPVLLAAGEEPRALGLTIWRTFLRSGHRMARIAFDFLETAIEEDTKVPGTFFETTGLTASEAHELLMYCHATKHPNARTTKNANVLGVVKIAVREAYGAEDKPEAANWASARTGM